MRREQYAAAAKTAGRHRFDHHVHVARMIEMFVRENDAVEFARIARRNVRECANQSAGTWIDVQLRGAEAHPHAAGRSNLTRDHKSRASGAQEEYVYHDLAGSTRGWVLLPSVTCRDTPLPAIQTKKSVEMRAILLERDAP